MNQVNPIEKTAANTIATNVAKRDSADNNSTAIKIPKSIWFLSKSYDLDQTFLYGFSSSKQPRNEDISNSGNVECLKRATRKDFLYNGSFHEAIGSVLLLAQFFAVMPVIGVKSDSASKLTFEWKSFRTIYVAIMSVLMVGYTGLSVNFMYKQKMEFDAISTPDFNNLLENH